MWQQTTISEERFSPDHQAAENRPTPLVLSTYGAENDGVAAEEGSVLCGICCCSRMLDHHHILVAGWTAPLKGSQSTKIILTELDNLKLSADCVKK